MSARSSRTSTSRASTGSIDDRSLEKFTNQQVEDLINQCVHCMLVLSQKRMPVKRSDITRLVCQGNGRVAKPIMKKAEVKLKKIFGLQVNYSQDFTKCYISSYRSETVRALDCIPDDVKDEQFVLFVVLSAIVMSASEVAKESDLIGLLDSIGISQQEQAKKYLDKFTKQDFLTQIKDGDERTYRWGERSAFEVDKAKLFSHFERIYEGKVKDLPESDDGDNSSNNTSQRTNDSH